MTVLAGYLLAWPSGQSLTRDAFEIRGLANRGAPNLTYRRLLYQVRSWEEFEFLSSEALAEEHRNAPSADGPYPYRVVCVRLGARVILLAERRDITDYLLDRVLARRIYPNLRKVGFRVDQVVESCRRSDSEFLITSLVGRFAGSERQLRTMTLYGDDITESAIFNEHHHLFNFTSCGIGRRLIDGLPRLSPSGEREIVRLGSEGVVSFVEVGRPRAREVTTVIDYVVQGGWIDDSTVE